MKFKLFAAAALALTFSAGLAGTAAADGAKEFRKCKACHVFDMKKKTGPSLGGVVGRACGAVEGYKYSKGYKAACEASGFVLDEAFLAAYILNPAGHLSDLMGKKIKSKMARQRVKDMPALIEYLKAN